MADQIAPRPKQYRKRKKFTTETFVENKSAELESLEQAKRSDAGLYCKACKARRSWTRIKSSYERQGTDFIRVWSCDQCGNVLREDNLDGR